MNLFRSIKSKSFLSIGAVAILAVTTVVTVRSFENSHSPTVSMPRMRAIEK
jgi:hypothetical protein